MVTQANSVPPVAEPRSVILAVISAKNDLANQIVLKMAKEADPTGNRTMGELTRLDKSSTCIYVVGWTSANPTAGIITKPDDLIPGSRREQYYSFLAQNKEVEFRLGWHVLKNMDSDKGLFTLANRNTEEKAFFSEGIWQSLPAHLLGIFELRTRLSKVLMRQIACELPSVIEELESKLEACRGRLDKMGQPRTTIDEQRLYLVKASQSFQTLAKASVDGTYTDVFFQDAKSDQGFNQRIRAVIQTLNHEFARKLEERGQYRQIVPAMPKPTPKPRSTDFSAEAIYTTVKPKKRGKPESADDTVRFTRTDFISYIQDLMLRTRGRELPGTFSPMIVADLFKEQCRPWKPILHDHVQRAGAAAKELLRLVCAYTADETACHFLLQEIVNPAIERIMKDLQEKADKLLLPHSSGHPITYNHYFTETLQKVRDERKASEVRSAVAKWLTKGEDDLTGTISLYGSYDMDALIANLTTRTESDMNRFAASEALDCMVAYYKVCSLAHRLFPILLMYYVI